MADSNGFRHQDYSSVPSADSFEFIRPSQLIVCGSVPFTVTMSHASDVLRSNGVSKIILVHGTLAGTDALGWYGHWHRVLPGLSSKIKSTYKSIVDKLSGDRGNYSASYTGMLEKSINGSGQPPIQIERFRWTSENHHLGRADAAVRLAKQILALDVDQNSRIMLWGHSHAGNVFALMTNLIGMNPESRKRFFDAVRHFHSTSGRVTIDDWRWLETHIQDRPRPKLDLVTFGTPVRYGWGPTGFDKLLHFVNHHPVDGVDSCRPMLPVTAQQFVEAFKGDYGDFVQQTFVAGSDLTPAIWSFNAWKANRMLSNLLEANAPKHKRLWRLRQGKRVAESGKTLLVDYAAVDPSAGELCGHAVYTKLDWMAFHLQEIVARFYRASHSESD